MNREVVAALNVFVGGMGHLGVAESFKVPAIKQKRLTQNTAAGERSISLGATESLDTEVNFKALPQAIYEEIAKQDDAELILKQSYKNGTDVKSMEWVCQGGIDLEYDEFKEGEYLGVKISQKGLKVYTHEVNGKVVVNIDHENAICLIGGKDLLEDVRNKIIG